MAGVSVVSAVAGTAVSVVSSKQQAKAAESTAEYNARVAENNAQNARNAATEAENTQRTKTARLLSKQKAQLGAAGIDLSSGSALQLQEDTITLGEADALRIRTTGDNQYDSSLQQSDLEIAKGSLAESQGNYNIAGSLLSGVGSVASIGVADKWFSSESDA